MSKVCTLCETVFPDMENNLTGHGCPIHRCWGTLHEVPPRYADLATQFFKHDCYLAVFHEDIDAHLLAPPVVYFLGTHDFPKEALYSALQGSINKFYYTMLINDDDVAKRQLKKICPSPCGYYVWGIRFAITTQAFARDLSIYGLIDLEAERLKYLYRVSEDLKMV